ncbi:MAG: bifunctional non-ous end joining protein LigD, partial [Solirubrobacteraceae bacterium]|nr:bifunctional non-ous end joining protein LigD [Solirubrobacteraceae bacterium]
AGVCGDALRERGLEPFAMVTGSRGIHVVAPLKRTRDVEDVLAWSRAFAAELAAAHPDALTDEFRKAKRGDRLYIDVARNGQAQTVVAPYAPRPRPGAPVATPLDWAELADDALVPDGWTLQTIGERLAALGGVPWADIDAAARARPRCARAHVSAAARARARSARPRCGTARRRPRGTAPRSAPTARRRPRSASGPAAC